MNSDSCVRLSSPESARYTLIEGHLNEMRQPPAPCLCAFSAQAATVLKRDDHFLCVVAKLGDSGAAAFAELRYHYANTKPMSTAVVPVSFGIRWAGR